MSDKTGISWTDATWNPIRGCSKVSAGCKNCYAEKVAARFSGPGQPYDGTVRDGRWNGQIRIVPEKLSEPMHWKRARRIFVNSMSDLFHADVPFEFIAAVFGVMAACPQHTFQLLTKRPTRAVEFFKWVASQRADGFARHTCGYEAWQAMDRTSHAARGAVADAGEDTLWPLPNVHLGVSVEDQETADERIPALLSCPAAVRFVSYEPALAAVDFAPYLRPNWDVFVGPCGCSERRDPWTRCDNCIHTLRWVIVGGESGPNARPFDAAWARSTIRQCRAAGVACFFKQAGSRPVVEEGSADAATWATMPGGRVDDCGGIHLRDRAGADPSEWPADLRVQEFPESAA